MPRPAPDSQAPDAALIWNDDVSGAAIAISVERASRDGGDAFRAVGIDEETESGFIETVSGKRVYLTDIDPDTLRAAMDCDVFVVHEVPRDGGDFHEYKIERLPIPSIGVAPGM